MSYELEGFVGGGDVYIDRFDSTGVKTGLIKLGNTQDFKITPDSEEIQLISRSYSTYGNIINSVMLPKPTKLSFTIDGMKKGDMALALMGTEVAYSQSSGSYTGDITIIKGKYVKLPHMNITEDTVVLNTNAVLGTDFEVNFTLGLLKVLPASTLVDGTEYSIAYDYTAQTGTTIEGSTQNAVTCYILLDGRNLATNQSILLEIDIASLTSKSGVSFIGKEFEKTILEGSMKIPPGKTSAYRLTYMD